MTVEKPLSQGEVIALIAALFATIAISIDAMLPAMPEIAATLSPDAPNRAQLVVTSFVFGMGLGTLIAGPLSDAFGRKIIILLGSALYVVAAIACYFAKTLDFLLIARVVQRFGAAAPRVVSTAMVRDLFSSRDLRRRMACDFSGLCGLFHHHPAVDGPASAPNAGRGSPPTPFCCSPVG